MSAGALMPLKSLDSLASDFESYNLPSNITAVEISFWALKMVDDETFLYYSATRTVRFVCSVVDNGLRHQSSLMFRRESKDKV